MAGDDTIPVGDIRLHLHLRRHSPKSQVIGSFLPLQRPTHRNTLIIRIKRRRTISTLVTFRRHLVHLRRCRCPCRRLTTINTALPIPIWILRIGSVGDILTVLLCRPKRPMLSIRRRLPFVMMLISRKKLLGLSPMKKTPANSLYLSCSMPPSPEGIFLIFGALVLYL